jgi:eukaryotic-like serine/threonine-protein kinase
MSIWSRYTKVKTINSGGMASVYIAVDNFTGRGVAIKEILPHLFKSDFVRQKFIAEANDYLYLRHPGIIKLENFVDEGASWFIIMEYFEGQSLAEFMKSRPHPMPFQNAAYIIKQVCDALYFVHNKGKVHLDIKPSNIMINPDNFKVKVIDFGISMDIRKEALKMPLGTPSYMSPEQIDSGRILPQTDIFSLGVTLCEMVSGRLPFVGQTREELFSQIKQKPTPQISAYYPPDLSLEKTMNMIIGKAMQKSSSDRYLDCKSFGDDLLKLA